MLAIHRAELSDLPQLLRLHRGIQSLHARMDPTVFRDPLDADALAALWRERLSQTGSTVLLAGRGDAAVGCICFELQDRPGDALVHAARRISVHHLAVDDSARRSGIGTRLMRTAEDEARRHGIAVVLAAMYANDAALAFYRARGYAPVSVTLRHLPDASG